MLHTCFPLLPTPLPYKTCFVGEWGGELRESRTMEVLSRCPLAIAQQLVHCAIAVSTAVLDRVTKTMSVTPLLTNNLDNSKQKTSNLLSPAPPPYSWSLLGKVEVPAPPPSSKISWSFDLAWNPVLQRTGFNTLDNWGHKTPTQSKKKRTGKKRL